MQDGFRIVSDVEISMSMISNHAGETTWWHSTVGPIQPLIMPYFSNFTVTIWSSKFDAEYTEGNRRLIGAHRPHLKHRTIRGILPFLVVLVQVLYAKRGDDVFNSAHSRNTNIFAFHALGNVLLRLRSQLSWNAPSSSVPLFKIQNRSCAMKDGEKQRPSNFLTESSNGLPQVLGYRLRFFSACPSYRPLLST